MYKHIIIIVFALFSLSIISQNKKIPSGYELITLDGEDAYMNFKTGDVIRTVPLKSSEKYINNIDAYEKTSSIHVVKKGDNLYRIARKYGLSIVYIMEINGLSNSMISIDQKLKITSSKTPSNNNKTDFSDNIYIVKKEDTLYSIAKKYTMNVTDLKTLNGLASNIIKVGQRLKLK